MAERILAKYEGVGSIPTSRSSFVPGAPIAMRVGLSNLGQVLLTELADARATK